MLDPHAPIVEREARRPLQRDRPGAASRGEAIEIEPREILSRQYPCGIEIEAGRIGRQTKVAGAGVPTRG
ncbi:hypothetical protein [Bradyrhizobium sp. JR3.5]